MAYEYNVPGLDLGAVGRAFSGAFQRQQQLNIKKQLYAEQVAEKEYKRLKDGVRDQDNELYNQKFNAWNESKKMYNRYNKGIFSNRQKLSEASSLKDKAYEDLLNFANQSSSYNGLLRELSKVYKDPSKVYDTERLSNVLLDLSSMNSEELNIKYKDGIPKNFEFKPDPNTQKAFFSQVDQIIKADPFLKKTSFIDAGDMDLTLTDLNGNVNTFKVPTTEMKIAIDPTKAVNSIYLASTSSPYNGDLVKDNFIRNKNILKDPNNENYSIVKGLFDNASKVYNKPIDQINQTELMSVQYLDPKEDNTIRITDYKALNARLSLLAAQASNDKEKRRIAHLKDEAAKAESTEKANAVSKAFRLIKMTQEVGGFTNPELTSKVNEAIYPILGVKLDQNSINKLNAAAQSNSLQQMQDAINKLYDEMKKSGK